MREREMTPGNRGRPSWPGARGGAVIGDTIQHPRADVYTLAEAQKFAEKAPPPFTGFGPPAPR